MLQLFFLVEVHALLQQVIVTTNNNHQGSFFRAGMKRQRSSSSSSPTLRRLPVSISSSSTTTTLFAVPQKRVARRDLKKRPNRRGRRSGNSVTASQKQQNASPPSSKVAIESELRPLVQAKKVEAGEDYWIDEADLQKSIQRKIALKNRKLQEGEISQEKLKTEVVAPYKQNWIGLVSVSFIALAVIVKNFPDLLNGPVIQNIPDL